jgi:photosystem II stability/assembly factor-like uncharacterized protein
MKLDDNPYIKMGAVRASKSGKRKAESGLFSRLSSYRWRQQTYRCYFEFCIGCVLKFRNQVCPFFIPLSAFRFPLFLLWASWACGVEPPPASPPETMRDAELTSVTFVDAEAGWAVGDRGVIWHTADGGRHWQQQDSPATCRLEHVCFLNPSEGWAVGGWPHAYAKRSSGVVLHTADGGRTWEAISGLTLPALRYVKFHNEQRGVAMGESSALYPSGVFTTSDGGKSWHALPSAVPADWLTADVSETPQGVLVSAQGQISTTNLLELKLARLPTGENRRAHAVKWTANGSAWLCGDAGLILRSQDQGQSWQGVASATELLVSQQLDFTSVATHGSHIWLAGNPGCIVLHSADAGATWETLQTEQALPLRDLHFADENRGWAVGALGTILATRDGGRSWRVQQQGGARAALLAIASRAEVLPAEMLVHLAGNEAYLTAVELFGERTHSLPMGDTLEQRTKAACSALGVATTEVNAGFSLDERYEFTQREAILAAWQQAGRDPLQRLEERLVRRIRQWRPDVIVTEQASPRGEFPLAHIMNQASIAAVQKAEDPRLYPEHGKLWGLAPWKVKKVFTTRLGNTSGNVTLTTTQLAPRLGWSLLDGGDMSRGLCTIRNEFIPMQQGFELLIDQLPQGQGRRDFFSGIPLAPGSEARRPFSTPTTTDLNQLAKRVQQRQALQKIFERLETDPPRGSNWLAQVTELTREAHAENATRALVTLAERYEQGGEWDFAAQTWQYVLDRYPQHSLSDVAATWLVRYHGSAEFSFRRETSRPFAAPAVATPSQPASGIQQVSATEATSAHLLDQDRTLRSLSLARQQEVKRPVWFADPAVRYAVAHATRARGEKDQAEKLFRGLASGGDVDSAWSLCAAAEGWLNQREGSCPKPLATVRRTAEKPLLNGKLEEACWQAAQPLALGKETQVALCYDDEFLFLAISCQRFPNIEYNAADKVRERDESLLGQDRVEFFFDVDRDYASYFQLTVDHRGRSAEACGHDTSWNPAWFIATGGDEKYWTIEAALAWKEGLPTPQGENNVWACGIQRRVPNHAVRSWSIPAHPAVIPAGFGLLEFIKE